MGLYVRATELLDAAALEKTTPEERKFVSTATYPNRRKDKADIEKFKGFSEEGSKIIDIHTSPGRDHKTTRICRGYRRVVYGDHGPYLELNTTLNGTNLGWSGSLLTHTTTLHSPQEVTPNCISRKGGVKGTSLTRPRTEGAEPFATTVEKDTPTTNPALYT